MVLLSLLLFPLGILWQILDVLWQLFSFIAPLLLAVIFLGYFVPHLTICLLYRRRNLKKAYNAEWALVTGASSGTKICLMQLHGCTYSDLNLPASITISR